MHIKRPDFRPASGESSQFDTMQWWLHVILLRDFTLLILILRAKAQKWLDEGGECVWGWGGVSTVWSPAEGAKEYCTLRTQVHSCSTPFCLFISLNFTVPTRERQESWLAGRGTVGSQGIMGMAHLARWAESGVKKANVSGIYADSHQPWWESQSFFLMSDPNSSFCAFSDGLP